MSEATLRLNKDREDGELSPAMNVLNNELTGEESDRSFRGKTHTKKRRSRYDELDEKFDKKYTNMDQKLDLLLSMAAENNRAATTSKDKLTTVSEGQKTVECGSDQQNDSDDSFISLCVKPTDKITSAEDSDSEKEDSKTISSKNLYDLFGDDAKVKIVKKKEGISIDTSQREVLETNYRTKSPSFLTSFCEDIVDLFPVDEDTEQFLQVPPLDSLIENCLIKRHGQKASFAKKKGGKALHSQPCKMVERIAYKGQQASRLGVIIQLYVQQSLGTLLSLLQSDSFDKDVAVKQIKDTFSMATKGLDQIGRSGAFHHIIRRTLSMTDTALYELTDASEFQNLPLSGEGVFGMGLEPLLKSRKEKKKLAEDLMPDIKAKFASKRKFENDSVTNLDTGASQAKKAYDRPHTSNNFRIPRVANDFRSQTSHYGPSNSSKRGTSKVYGSKTPASTGRGRGRDASK